ncbi:sulfotransferase domain-containing protein [Candidatus Pelagibacter sp. HIMB1509]|uniref:sulfotransferase domain-containing protein n=1 Tax=Candidatus Pelagibacter sp. HIMB1509 TaxID=3413339 RepID=UPI003F84A4C4
MIIWLASYPKSGNTYVRAFLSAYYFSDNGQFDFNLISNIDQFPHEKYFNQKVDNFEEASKLWIPIQKKINKDKKIRFFKTHSFLGNYKGNEFASHETTLGAIYIIRDPRNVFTSIKNHYSLDNEKALEMITDKTRSLMSNNGSHASLTYISSWAENYLSWFRNNKFRRFFVKYEDLIENRYETFRDLIVFTNALMNNVEGVNKLKLQKAIETTNFNILKKREMSETFNNTDNSFKNWRKFHSENKNLFFNLGPENNWEKILEREFAEKIKTGFKKEMKELKYL